MFGTIGSGGAILVIVLLLIAHKKNAGRIKPIKDHTVLWWSAVLGLLTASAGQALAPVAGISATLTTSLGAQAGTVGVIGAGATALVLLVIGLAFKPHLAKDLIVGVALPGALSAAGGLLALPVTIVTALLHGFGI